MASSSTLSSVFVRWLVSLLMLAKGGTEVSSPQVRVMTNLADGRQPASESRVTARGPERISVAWCIESGDQAGVYCRQRINYIWDAAPVRLSGGDYINPRDLAIAYDDRGDLHLVWTDLSRGHRRVFSAALSNESSITREPWIVNPGGEADADYPSIANEQGAGLVILWQSAKQTRFSLAAALLGEDGATVRSISSPSGNSQTAISPQIVRANPLVVTWGEILDSRTELRGAILNAEADGWDQIELGIINQIVPSGRQPVIRLAGDAAAPVICWADESAEGSSRIEIVRGWNGETARFAVDQPEGEHRQPEVAPANEDQFNMAWQVFSRDSQSIQFAPLAAAADSIQGVRLSPAAHRFAADPSLVSRGNWSVVTWTDDYLDGGSGEVGLAEIYWPEQTSETK